MKTISLKEFTNKFMAISDNLTRAEIRLLYLLITEPSVIKISHKSIADRIKTDRRTIWIGLKNLNEHKYISDINITNESKQESDKNITKSKTKRRIKTLDERSEKKNKQSNKINSENISPNLDYHEFIQQIVVYKQYDLVESFFTQYPDKHGDILTNLKDDLPDNIDTLAKKFGFEGKLSIIRISRDLIKELERDKEPEVPNPAAWSHSYISLFNRGQKKAAIAVIRDVLIYLPLKFDEFMKSISAYKFDDMDEIVKSMKLEIYGKDIL